MSTPHCALVTGATQGIGHAVAARLAAAGHDIVIHGIDAHATGEAIAHELSATHGVRCAYVQADLRDMSAASGLWAQAAQQLRTPDILVNNAGIQHTCPIETFPDDRWQAILAVNLTAKRGLVGLSKGVALETAAQGITGVALPVDGGWTAQ